MGVLPSVPLEEEVLLASVCSVTEACHRGPFSVSYKSPFDDASPTKARTSIGHCALE